MKEILVDNSDGESDLFRMTRLAFTLVSVEACYKDIPCSVKTKNPFRLHSTWSYPDDMMTCYSNGIVKFQAITDRGITTYCMFEDKGEVE